MFQFQQRLTSWPLPTCRRQKIEHFCLIGAGFFSVQEPFFCKAYDILLHKNFSKLAVEEKKLEKNLEEKKTLEKKVEKIARELKKYIDHQKVSIFPEGSTWHLPARAAVLSVCLLLRQIAAWPWRT